MENTASLLLRTLMAPTAIGWGFGILVKNGSFVFVGQFA